MGTCNSSSALSKGVEEEGEMSAVEPVEPGKGKSETKTGSSPEKNLPLKSKGNLGSPELSKLRYTNYIKYWR